MKLRIDKRGFDRKVRDLEKFIKTTEGRNVIKQLMEFTENMVYLRIKSGYGVTSDTSLTAKNKRLKALSKSYKQFRAGKVAFATGKYGQVYSYVPKTSPRLGPYGSPNRSNLTLTGQMLRALSGKLTGRGFKLDIKNTTRSGELLTNNMVAEYVSKDRPFLALTVQEQRQIVREYERLIRKLVLKTNLTRRK